MSCLTVCVCVCLLILQIDVTAHRRGEVVRKLCFLFRLMNAPLNFMKIKGKADIVTNMRGAEHHWRVINGTFDEIFL